MTIIGVCGVARSGKDTIGRIVTELVPGAQTIALADPIKAICKKIFGFSDEQLYGSLKEIPDKRYPRNCPYCNHGFLDVVHNGRNNIIRCDDCDGTGIIYLTPRWAMQYIGTEIARALYTNVWVDYALRRAGELLRGESIKVGPDQFVRGAGETDVCLIVVVTDVRFPNEGESIRANGGITWRVIRPDVEKQLSEKSRQHASETLLKSLEMEQYIDAVVVNDAGIIDLKGAVGAQLRAANLLS